MEKKREARTIRLDPENDEYLDTHGKKKADVLNFIVREYRQKNEGVDKELQREIARIDAERSELARKINQIAEDMRYFEWAKKEKLAELKQIQDRQDAEKLKAIMAAKPEASK